MGNHMVRRVREVTGAMLPSSRQADAAGAGLLVLVAGWMALGAGRGEGDAGPVLWLVAAAAALFVAGRWASEHESLAAHRVIALGVAGAIVLTMPGVTRAGGAPIGYANANAALAALGALAAFGLAAAATAPLPRAAWSTVTAGLALAVVTTGSVAGAACLAGAALLLLVGAFLRRPVVSILGGVVVVVGVLGATVAIAHGADPFGLGERSDARGELWSAAADLAAAHPLRGVGIAAFEAHNPVSADDDLRWAHHGYLQVAAEAGLTGLALVLVLSGWIYGRLALAAVRAPHRAALGAAALTVVALHATVDHVLHAPAIPLTLAVFLGATTALPAAPRDQGSPG